MSSHFEPQDPAFETRLRESFALQRVMQTLKVRIAHIAPGEVDLVMPFQLELTQQNGFLHAGIVTTVVDSACGYAAFTLMPSGSDVLSVEFKVNLLAPARGEELVARGRVLRQGHTLSVVCGEALARQGGEEKHVAQMQGTMFCVNARS
jgi:uncharacterized protein (TIGR00369 family)